MNDSKFEHTSSDQNFSELNSSDVNKKSKIFYGEYTKNNSIYIPSSISSIKKRNTSECIDINDSFLKQNLFEPLITNRVKKMSAMFEGCISLTSLPDISKWNISNVTNMSNMFYQCESLKEIHDISKWSTSKVENMSYLFYGCKSLISLPNMSKYWERHQHE